MSQRSLTQTQAKSSFTPVQTGVLQRKCTSCGQHTISGGECAECTKNKGGLQRKLTIGASSDPLEQEADRIADQVMRMPEPSIQRQMEPEEEGMVQRQGVANQITPLVQRQVLPEMEEEEEEVIQTKTIDNQAAPSSPTRESSEVPPTVHEVLRSPGHPLDPVTRAFMEPRFGHDFSRVRVHSDAAAERSAWKVNAQAYTVGHDIVFGARHFAPETQTGRWLIAHELTHVVQQSSALRRINPGSGEGEAVHDPYQQVADRVKEHAIGSHAFATNGGASERLQRYEPPSDVTAVPVKQKAYYRIRQVVADIRRIVPFLSYKPPAYDTAMSMVENIYTSVDDWLMALLTPNRLMKVFGLGWSAAHQWGLAARNAVGEMFGILHRAQSDARLRGETSPRPSLIDTQIAVIEFAAPYIEKLENAVSYELPGAENLPDVPTKFTKLPRSEAHVLAWLVKHKVEIASAAAKFKVDRRAVAGAIAWESIVQVKSSSFRAVGPGKPHIWEFWGTSAVDEVEEMGYLPDRDDDQQEAVLKTPAVASEYIAAIMGAFADISAGYGLQIRNDPGVLATIYHGWRPSEWKERMEDKAAAHLKGTPWPRPVVANPMGIWVDEHLPYLEEAVGFTAAEQRTIGEKPHGATGEGKTAPLE